MKPNYTDFGLSRCMGPRLRSTVEEQLSNDLIEYGIERDVFKFDWSESVIEGRNTDYLDGNVENFSGIEVFNADDEIVAEGWMEFIHDRRQDFFIAFWEYLDVYTYGKQVEVKGEPGVPLHVLMKLPMSTRKNLKDFYTKGNMSI